MSDESKYGALVITLNRGSGLNTTKGVYLNNDLYITAKRDGNRIKLFLIGEKGRYDLRRNSPKSDISHVDIELVDEVILHERKQRAVSESNSKKSKVFKKKA